MLQILPYDLPDADLLRASAKEKCSCVFVPPRVMVVLGRGSDVSRELYMENILADGVPVIQRNSGGCAVVLSPEMLAASLVFHQKPQKNSAEYFQICNTAVLRALNFFGVTELEPSGISDISRRGWKLSGSAIYRNRERVFYHTIINLSGEPDLIERYLQFPPRTPSYRMNRPHLAFVTSLKAEGFPLEADLLSQQLEIEFSTLG